MPEAPAVWGMMATPLTDQLAVDIASMRGYAETLVERGCHGLVVLGVIAEPGALSLAEKLDSIESALAADVPVIAGLMAADAELQRADAAAFGARYRTQLSALMIPIVSPDAREVIDRVEQVHAVSGLPVVLQDYPAASGVTIAVEALQEVVTATGVTMVKSEGQPTFHRIQQLKDAGPDLTLMTGLGGLSLLEDLASGATAVATGITRPEIICAATALWSSGDAEGARDRIGPIGSLISFETQQRTSIGIRKEHWRRQGVFASAAVRPPTIPYQPAFESLSRRLGY